VDRTETFFQSAWRILFVANEFNERQVFRFIDLEWLFLIFGVFMLGFEWQETASVIPFMKTDVDSHIPRNYVLKYFLAVVLLLIIGIIMYSKAGF